MGRCIFRGTSQEEWAWWHFFPGLNGPLFFPLEPSEGRQRERAPQHSGVPARKGCGAFNPWPDACLAGGMCTFTLCYYSSARWARFWKNVTRVLRSLTDIEKSAHWSLAGAAPSGWVRTRGCKLHSHHVAGQECTMFPWDWRVPVETVYPMEWKERPCLAAVIGEAGEEGDLKWMRN